MVSATLLVTMLCKVRSWCPDSWWLVVLLLVVLLSWSSQPSPSARCPGPSPVRAPACLLRVPCMESVLCGFHIDILLDSIDVNHFDK